VNGVPRHHIGAGEGNRTLMTSLEGWGSAIELRPRAGSRSQDPASVAYRVAVMQRTFAASRAARYSKDA
jgi:hypothetical protein